MRGVERAVVLAAGQGTRLKWLTRERPKALMPVAGQAAIIRVIRRLAEQGIRDIAVNVHHHADVLTDALGSGEKLGVRIYFSHEAQLLDSGGGVRTALGLLPGSGPVLVHNADVLSDIDIRVLAGHCPERACAIALVPNPVHHPQGDFALQGHRVLADGKVHYTFAGVSVWGAGALGTYPVEEAFSLVEPVRCLIAQGRCRGLLHRGTWFDIGRPADLMRANRSLRYATD